MNKWWTQWRSQDFVLREGAVAPERVCTNFNSPFPHVASKVPASPHTKLHLDPFGCFGTIHSADGRTDRRTTQQ